MNKKLIAAAVAAAVAGPTLMSAASADVSVYGALYPRISISDGDTTLEDGGSRFGFKSSTDMGNGNTVSGLIEAGFSTSTAGTIGGTSRKGNVSYSGDWGSATIGGTGSIMAAAIKACVAGGQSCNQVGYQGRVASSLTLSGDLGGLNLDLQTLFDGTDGVASWAVATSVDFGSLGVGAAYRDDGTDQFTNVGASTTLAGVYVGVEMGDSSDGTDSWGVGVKLPGGIKIGVDNGGDDNQDVAASYDIDLGGSTLSLRIADKEPADTVVKAQFSYSL